MLISSRTVAPSILSNISSRTVATSILSNYTFEDSGYKHPVQLYLRGRWLQASCPTISLRTVATSILSNYTFEEASNFKVDNFEDCYFTDGHEEYGYLNDGQGVYETPGAYQEASTKTLAIKDQLLPH